MFEAHASLVGIVTSVGAIDSQTPVVASTRASMCEGEALASVGAVAVCLGVCERAAPMGEIRTQLGRTAGRPTRFATHRAAVGFDARGTRAKRNSVASAGALR